MPLIIHGAYLSTCTRRVITILNEKNVPFELVNINFGTGEHKSAPFMAMQPFGQVPVLEDDGFFVYESRAICKYIERKYKGQGTLLMPEETDLKGYALFEQACSVELCHFDPPAARIALEKIFKPMMRAGPPNEPLIVELALQLDKALAVYEAILSKQPYLAGQKLTMVDLFHLPYGSMARQIGYGEIFDKYPNVTKWLDGLEARESWVKANPK